MTARQYRARVAAKERAQSRTTGVALALAMGTFGGFLSYVAALSVLDPVAAGISADADPMRLAVAVAFCATMGAGSLIAGAAFAWMVRP